MTTFENMSTLAPVEQILIHRQLSSSKRTVTIKTNSFDSAHIKKRAQLRGKRRNLKSKRFNRRLTYRIPPRAPFVSNDQLISKFEKNAAEDSAPLPQDSLRISGLIANTFGSMIGLL
jgi:hypothetical protein